MPGAFDYAATNPGARVIVLVRNHRDLDGQFSDLALTLGARLNRVSRVAAFPNGSTVRKLKMEPNRLHGLRADVVLADTRFTRRERDWAEILLSEPGNERELVPFSILVESA